MPKSGCMNEFRRWWDRVAGLLRRCTGYRSQAPASGSHPVLVVVEGPRDVEFLRRISMILHRSDPTIPDLADLEAIGRIVLIPFGATLGLGPFA